jgi:hypothetical protein
VSDYRPAARAEQKIKKRAKALELALVRNADILAEVAGGEHPPFTVGFAAETEKLEVHAREKLARGVRRRYDKPAKQTPGATVPRWSQAGLPSSPDAVTR